MRVGAKTKVFVAKVGNKRHTIGPYPRTTLQDARKRLFTIKGDATPAPGPDITLQSAVDLFLTHHCRNYRPRPKSNMIHVLGKLAPLNQKKLASITIHDLHAIIDLQTPSQANKLFCNARTLLRFCMRRKFIQTSPLSDAPLPHKEQSRARVLSDEELKQIWSACSDHTNNMPQTFRTIVKLLICLGSRRNEISSLKWSWISEDRISWPPEIMKNGRSHWLPLLPFTKSILQQIPRNSDLLFPARRHEDRPFSGWSTSNKFLWQHSQVFNATLHDVRRSWASINAAWTPPHVLERALSHVSGTISGVAAIYNKFQYERELIDCYQQWEAHLLKILTPNYPHPEPTPDLCAC
jgi:integrase